MAMKKINESLRVMADEVTFNLVIKEFSGAGHTNMPNHFGILNLNKLPKDFTSWITLRIFLPPELLEHAFGINFARDGMPEKDWLALVVVHGDAWLLSVAFYFGARFGFDKADRKHLFNMINDLPTIFEVVSG
ncbi:hypothetical protein CTI12_AA385570 [Artemisia annua]|uniref:PHD finger protein ALFIN-LIKE n=1 Tax=Artemisia annua TaxID=35608 RepID=A0A2U1MFS3_ARTAN|nr:hypothetical protein CTI12_AA385570 [Artemisia annua]